MEIEQLQLWARWLELQRDRAIAVLELEQEEEAEGRRQSVKIKSILMNNKETSIYVCFLRLKYTLPKKNIYM